MDILSLILIIAGLALFETISSIDNAVINAEVLTKVSDKSRRWFLTYGMLIAVFGLRFLLPLGIVWSANPALSPLDILTSAFNSDPAVLEAIEMSSPVLLAGGGVFLVFLFFHWIFLEEKNLGLPRTEKFFMKRGVWFYTIISIILTVIVWFALQENTMMAFGGVVGSTAFFITHGFKQNAEEKEKELLGAEGTKEMSDWSKILYLEVIDATFSIDGVVGAFAFTMSVPLIIIGSGIGAFIVRHVTISNIKSVKKYRYLKNGAMYSILVLGMVMLADAFGAHIPEYLSPLCTFVILGYFFLKSKREMEQK
ncbi:DUF475 domain-containing protein [Candidatus Micrarchaeota archaeon]|nr:DUF475 domain-containing protein [Candidatus Micrarchaeota archaeon]